MVKNILFTITFICSVGYSNCYAQNTSIQVSKSEYLKYEFSFSSDEFQEVRDMETFITNITKAKNVHFNAANYKVVVTTDYKLDYNIIKGKFEKHGVELLTFKKV